VSKRPRQGSPRRVATERTRARLVKAASAMLAARDGVSLDAVAKKAGVTRLTIYNQFGSRRALLEAVFDDMAERGGLHRLREAMANPDPHLAVGSIVSIFCEFWSVHPGALWRLHAAGATDPELEQSLRARNQRRRHLFSVLVGRMIAGEDERTETTTELVDVLFALTSVAFFWELKAGGRDTNAACRLIQALAADSVQRALSQAE
jgi:AcrR family transcriptional regulator